MAHRDVLNALSIGSLIGRADVCSETLKTINTTLWALEGRSGLKDTQAATAKVTEIQKLMAELHSELLKLGTSIG